MALSPSNQNLTWESILLLQKTVAEGTWFCFCFFLFSFLLHPQHLQQCLAHSSYSINMCWINGELFSKFQNYNLLLNNHQQKNVGSHQKKIPHVQGQRQSPSNMVRGAKFLLESNLIPVRDAQQNFVRTITQRSHGDWARPAFDCLSVSCRGTGEQCPATGAGAPDVADLGHTMCDISPFRGGHL